MADAPAGFRRSTSARGWIVPVQSRKEKQFEKLRLENEALKSKLAALEEAVGKLLEDRE